jgi:hypothetical protein
LDISADGALIYVLTAEGDTKLLVEVSRQPGKPPRPLLTFSTAPPVAIDAARDGSLYSDHMMFLRSVLRFSTAGGVPEEFSVSLSSNVAVLPGGEAVLTMNGWGSHRLAALRPGMEPRILVETTEESNAPATTFDGKLAFLIGSGNAQRIAVASLRDGRVLRRYSTRAESGMSASPDGQTLYYSFSGSIWAQPVAGGEPKRLTEGVDVALDPTGRYLYARRSRKGMLAVFRVPVEGGEGEELAVPPEYHIAFPPLSPAAVDDRGRLLVTVVSAHSFYYSTAILDPTAKTFTIVPVGIDGDVSAAGWAPDGRIVSGGNRYLTSLWRYQRSKTLKSF